VQLELVRHPAMQQYSATTTDNDAMHVAERMSNFEKIVLT
jgi:hypothetical protein